MSSLAVYTFPAADTRAFRTLEPRREEEEGPLRPGLFSRLLGTTPCPSWRPRLWPRCRSLSAAVEVGRLGTTCSAPDSGARLPRELPPSLTLARLAGGEEEEESREEDEEEELREEDAAREEGGSPARTAGRATAATREDEGEANGRVGG